MTADEFVKAVTAESGRRAFPPRDRRFEGADQELDAGELGEGGDEFRPGGGFKQSDRLLAEGQRAGLAEQPADLGKETERLPGMRQVSLGLEAVCRLVDWARTGPRQAAVDDVAVQPEPPEGLSAFRLR